MEINEIEEEFIYSRIVHLDSTNRIVLPHVFFIDEVNIDHSSIRSWFLQLSQADRDRFISTIEDEVVGNFFTAYPHKPEDIQLEQVIMITEGGVKSLIKYTLLKKRKINKNDVYQFVQKITNAFAIAKQNKWRNNVFDDRKYEDKQYIPDKMKTQDVKIEIKDQANVIFQTMNGGNNKVTANINPSKKSLPKWVMVVGWIMFILFVCIFVFLCWREYQVSHDISTVLTSKHWEKWISTVLAVILLVLRQIFN